MYDYKNEPRRLIFAIDNKSFYASCECVELGINPLEAVLVVMSRADNTGSGLVLATSPMAKKKYGIKNNVSHGCDLPMLKEMIIVPPRMNLYIHRNLQINNIFREYVADEDLHPYSIDESILDLTKSWRLFGKTPFDVARRIQREVRDKLGLYTTVGIGDNPLLAKLALDNEAKHNESFMAYWSYQNVPDKVWKIDNLTDFWGVNKRTEKRLNKLGIYTIKELASYDPYWLKKEFGVVGEQLFAHSWGVDRSILTQKFHAKSKSFGNSQVLPRDYTKQRDIEIVIREIGEQVASRIRSRHKMARNIHLYVGFGFNQISDKSGFGKSKKIEATNLNKDIVAQLLLMFRELYNGEIVRNISVSVGDLTDDNDLQLDIFQKADKQIKAHDLDYLVDDIRKRFGFNSLIKASSLLDAGTAKSRASLVGGHSGGNAYD
ncbi:Y-family DNA polymerase [Companilactobacillus allii]|uniref:UmuC domain-containing protein n=1 Tax=Companilactobacillus allii TaxID=1847728 RepID=A0A1P8Q0P2_9LACO|nr:Y-family DNA polymerase [Companilactobacillus allii]APX71438.1 hypothetical protein BTM29_02200 [Companilactobacillus allii]USQ68519.1 Y-family DNA polymerase [Companilactobacillus allii]